MLIKSYCTPTRALLLSMLSTMVIWIIHYLPALPHIRILYVDYKLFCTQCFYLSPSNASWGGSHIDDGLVLPPFCREPAGRWYRRRNVARNLQKRTMIMIYISLFVVNSIIDFIWLQSRKNIDHDLAFLLIQCNCFAKLIPILMRRNFILKSFQQLLTFAVVVVA